MALNSGKILMRRGQEVNFDPNKMMPGEWAVSLDSKFVRMCFSPGVCIRMATYEAFEADMEQIRDILAECQTVEEAVQRIYEDIKDVAVDVERIETAAANALKSEQNALNSANSASQSANTATQKASNAAESANIASTKAEQATEGASTATQKASEAAGSADNVRNMSEVSQSYAVGGTGTREGEDTDNSKYYNQQASDNADRAEAAAERASAVADVGVATTEKAGLVKPDGETIRVDSDGTIHADRGTTSYTDLENKPKINDVELDGDKTLDELGIASKEALKETDNKVNIIIENAELRFKENASGENIHLNDSADSKLVEFGLYGKAVQDGTPTPQNPVDIEVSGSGGSVEVKSVGKNLLNIDTKTQTSNGVTLTVNKADKSIIANGTVTNDVNFVISRYSGDASKLNGKYLSGSVGGSKETYYIRISDTIVSAVDNLTGDTKISTLTNTGVIRVSLYFKAGITLNNVKFYPMISDDGGEYEPYKETLATIPTTNGLAGIPVDSGGNYTDENGQQWICDEVVKYADGSGEYIKRVKTVRVTREQKGPFTHPLTEGQRRFAIKSSGDDWISESLGTTAISTHFVWNYLNSGNHGKFYVSNTYAVFTDNDSYWSNVEAFKSWLDANEVYITYPLAQPITTPLTAEQLAEIEKLSTFYPVTSMSNDADCGMKIKYIVDSKNYIDNQLAIQAKLQEEALLNMLLLMPEEVQASMIEKDTNNLLNESEV